MPTIQEHKPQLEALKRELEEEGEMSDNHGSITLVGAQIDDQGLSWIEVMYPVEKARNGPWYFTVTPDDLGVLAEYIKANPDRIPIDYDHAGAENGGSTRAAGWFTGGAQVIEAGTQNPLGDVQERASVWAEVKWTPTAIDEIRGGDYRFLSPEWGFTDKDPKTGLLTKLKDLAAATLINRPFFKDLAPVTAAQLAEKVAELSITAADIEALLAADNAPYGDVTYADPGYQKDGQKRYPLDTETHIRAAWSYINQEGNAGKYSPEDLAKVKAKIKAAMKRIGAEMADSSGGSPSAADQGNQDDPKEKIVADETVVTDYMKMLGLDETVDPKQRLAVAFRDKDEKILALETKVTELTASSGEKSKEAEELASRIEELELKDRVRDIDSLLARAVEKGKVLPVEKETLAEVFASDVNGLRRVLAARTSNMFMPEQKGQSTAPEYDRFADDADVAQYVKTLGAGDDPVDTEQAKQHLLAMDILKEQGKSDKYTDAEYVAAYNRASALVY
jgi:phage I-like protein